MPTPKIKVQTYKLLLDVSEFGPVTTTDGPASPLTLSLTYDGQHHGTYKLTANLVALDAAGERVYLDLLSRQPDNRPDWLNPILRNHQPHGWDLPEHPALYGPLATTN
ncbi:hypothetical protein [Streptomyces sp. MJM8645]|uniref:hypothetical protein n=1 Tax=Streptomyces sp. MJM8645 TaxID=1120523 RepID=UPI0007AFB000|nr:hypothetical protein [Streptomyces sp. MJM8645]